MRTDQELANIADDPDFKALSPAAQGLLLEDAKRSKASKPLVTMAAADPAPAKPKRSRSIVEKRTEANDPIAAVLPKPRPVPPGARRKSQGQKDIEAQSEQKAARRIGTSGKIPTLETVAENIAPGFQEMGNLTYEGGKAMSEAIAAPTRRALAENDERQRSPIEKAAQASPAARRRVPNYFPPKSISEQVVEGVDALVEPYASAAQDLKQEPSRLAPWSPGAGEGAGAFAGGVAANVVDPVGDALMGAPIAAAAKGGKAIANRLAKRAADAARAAKVPKAPLTVLPAPRDLTGADLGDLVPRAVAGDTEALGIVGRFADDLQRRGEAIKRDGPRNGMSHKEAFAQGDALMERSAYILDQITQKNIQRPEPGVPRLESNRSSFGRMSAMADKKPPAIEAPTTPAPDPAGGSALEAPARGPEPWEQRRGDFMRDRVRPSLTSDAPTVEGHARWLRSPEGPPGISIENDYMRRFEKEDPSIKMIVERGQNGQPIGILRVFLDDTGTPDLVSVAVDPAHRRQGIATRLYAEAKRAGYDVDRASGTEGLTDEGAAFNHARRVRGAVSEGRPVPPEVLADYPDLAPQGVNQGGGMLRRLASEERGEFDINKLVPQPKRNAVARAAQGADPQDLTQPLQAPKPTGVGIEYEMQGYRAVPLNNGEPYSFAGPFREGFVPKQGFGESDMTSWPPPDWYDPHNPPAPWRSGEDIAEWEIRRSMGQRRRADYPDQGEYIDVTAETVPGEKAPRMLTGGPARPDDLAPSGMRETQGAAPTASKAAAPVTAFDVKVKQFAAKDPASATARAAAATLKQNAKTPTQRRVAALIDARLESMREAGLSVDVVYGDIAAPDGLEVPPALAGVKGFVNSNFLQPAREGMAANSIFIQSGAAGDYEVLAHEMIHAVTVEGLRLMPDSPPSRAIGALQEKAARAAQTQGGLFGEYVASASPGAPDPAAVGRAAEDMLRSYITASPEEFVAYGLTNPAFQRWLQVVDIKAPAPDGRVRAFVRGVEESAQPGSLWQGFVRAVAALLDAGKRDVPAIEALMRATEDMGALTDAIATQARGVEGRQGPLSAASTVQAHSLLRAQDEAAARAGVPLYQRLATEEDGAFRPEAIGQAIRRLFGQEDGGSPAGAAPDAQATVPQAGVEGRTALASTPPLAVTADIERAYRLRDVFARSGNQRGVSDMQARIDALEGPFREAAAPPPPSAQQLRGRINNLRGRERKALEAGDQVAAGRLAAEAQMIEDQVAPPVPKGLRTDPDSVAASRYQNFRKFGGSDGESRVFADLVQKSVAEAGADPKARVSFDDIRNEAAALDPRLLDTIAKKGLQPGETMHPAVRQAMRDRVKSISGEIDNIERQINERLLHQQPEAVGDLEALTNQLRRDAQTYIDMLIPARSQDGRNLAFHRMTAAQSFEPEYWIAKARRIAHGNAAVPMSAPVERRLSDTLRRGDNAKQRLDTLVAELKRRGVDTSAIENPRVSVPPSIEDGGVMSSFMNQVRRLFGQESGEWNQEAFNAWIRKAATPQPRSGAVRVPRGARPGRVGVEAAGPGMTGDPEIDALLAEAWKAAQEVHGARVDVSAQLTELEQTGWLEAIATTRKAGLLTGVKTIARNMFGTWGSLGLEEVVKMPASAIDAILAAARLTEEAGQRSTLRPRWREIGAGLNEARTRGFQEFKEVMVHGATIEDLARVDYVREMNTGIKPLDAYVNTVMRFQGAQDRLGKAYAYTRSIQEQARAMTLGDESAGQALLANPSEDMVRQAIADAEFATFTNDTMLGDKLVQIARGEKRHGAPGSLWGFIADNIMPFKKTPAAVATRVVDYTPIGVTIRLGSVFADRVKDGRPITAKLSRAEQRVVSNAIARGGVGAGLIATGAFMAHNARAVGNYDPRRREEDEMSGRQPGSVRMPESLGGGWVPVGSLSPIGNLIALGASLYESGFSGLGMTAGALGTVLDQPMTQGAQQLIKLTNPSEEGLQRDLTRVAASQVGSYTPTILSEIAQAADGFGQDDGYARARQINTQDMGSAIADSVADRLPGGRTSLPPKVDALGKEVRVPGGLSAFGAFAGRPATESDDPVAQAIIGLGIDLKPVSRSIMDYGRRGRADDVSVKMTPQMEQRFRTMRGTSVHSAIEAALASEPFAQAAAAGDRDRMREIVQAAVSKGQSTASKAFRKESEHDIKAGRPQAMEEKQRKARARVLPTAGDEPWWAKPGALVPPGARRPRGPEATPAP